MVHEVRERTALVQAAGAAAAEDYHDTSDRQDHFWEALRSTINVCVKGQTNLSCLVEQGVLVDTRPKETEPVVPGEEDGEFNATPPVFTTAVDADFTPGGSKRRLGLLEEDECGGLTPTKKNRASPPESPSRH